MEQRDEVRMNKCTGFNSNARDCPVHSPGALFTDAEIERAARIAHELNRAWCVLNGDLSQASWDQAPQWQRDSAVMGVRAIAQNPQLTPEDSHIGWVEHKFSEGWNYGPEKDSAAKLHPCMRPYAELPPAQRVKDTLFGAAVRAALGLL